MTAASSFVDEMATLLAEVNARLEGIVGKPLCFALAVVHGDDGEGAFWYTSPNGPNLLSEPLADTLRHAADDLDPKDDDGSTAPSSALAS
jgi:hypothetical protein